MFIITSVIYPIKNKLDYTECRSIFSPEERLDQTLKTVESVRRITKEKIILVECSNYAKENFDISALKRSVDIFLDLSQNEQKLNISNGKYKSLSEAIMLSSVLDYIPEDEKIFKLSGRYYLNNNFDISNLEKGEVCSKIFNDNFHNRCFDSFRGQRSCTVLYYMKNKKYLKKYCDFCLNHVYNDYYLQFLSQEEILYFWALNFNYVIVDKINVSGKIAVNGKFESY